MKKYNQEIKIALVAIVGLVALFFGVKFLKGRDLLSNSSSYYFTFNDLSGLTESSPIYVSGYRVGRVKKIIFDFGQNEQTKVLAEIDQRLQIPKGSTASISSDVLGNIKVTLNMAPNQGKYIQPGEPIPGAIDGGTVGKVAEMIPTVQQLLPKLDTIMYHLNVLLSDPALVRSAHNIETLTNNLNESSIQLHALLAQVNQNVPNVVSNANRILDNTAQFTNKLQQIDITSTMEKVDKAIADVNEATNKLNSNQGTIGLLMRDPSLYNNLNNTMKNVDSLVTNLRQHPKRYVHFSIFGRKER